MDEACSRLRLEQESKPEIIWKVERDCLTKQIEMTALANEDDVKAIARKEHLQEEILELNNRLTSLNSLWHAEKEELERTKTIQERLDGAKRELDRARAKGDFNAAGRLQHGTIPQLEAELRDIENNSEEGNNETSFKMLADFVTADAVASCVASKTGIPVSKITGSESKKLLQMENKLREVRYMYHINNIFIILCILIFLHV